MGMKAPAGVPFDVVVLTAANAAQARGYAAQLRWRRADDGLPPGTRFLVAADPGGRRVGSFGATLHALARLAGVLAAARRGRRAACPADLFRGRRILICHSGGDSRRIPAYAAQGKVFLPLPAVLDADRPAAMFDLILANAAKLPAPADGRGQVVILAGDVLLTMDTAALDVSAPGVVGVATPGLPERGARHGVYVVDGPLTADRPRPVRDFLQKPDLAAARARGALDASGRLLVDTGILSLDPDTVGRLLALAGLRLVRGAPRAGPGLLVDLARGACPPLDLYEELTMALAPRLTRARYVAALADRAADPAHVRRLDRLHRALAGTPFTVNIQPACEFFHVGTSRELLANMSLLTRTAQLYGFRNGRGALNAAGAPLEGVFVLDSLVETARVRAGPGVFLEGCDVAVPLALEGDNVLVGLPRAAREPVSLRRGLGLVCLPVGRTRWVAVLFGMDDDFKGWRGDAAAAGGCGFLNAPVGRWLASHGLAPDDLWAPGMPQTLWHARLWRPADLPAALRAARWMQAPAGAAPAAWRRGPRLCMDQLLRRVNHARLIGQRQAIRRQVDLRRLPERLAADDRLAADALVRQLQTPAEAAAAFAQAAAAGTAPGAPLFRARALELARRILEAHPLPREAVRRQGFADARALGQAVLDRVAAALAPESGPAARPRPAAILHDQVVWVTTPVRLDFAGGWSDTPPFCLERGGNVLNAAITLNGQYPVQVMAKLNRDRCVRLSSIDLGRRCELRDAAEILDHHDPRDWAALPKAALVLAGIAPDRPGASLARRLDLLGGGLDLTIFSAVPKGSGLGTSSILGAAVLACLLRVRGEPASPERLTALTSVLEQRMRTGGGWQDQVGGIVPGVKLIRTRPGPDQTPGLQWVVFNMAPGGAFGGRLLLYYTGQKRMARDILHNVVRRYLARDAAILRVLDEIKDLPLRMKAELDAQQADAFARSLDRYWHLKQQIDAGATNPRLDAILRAARPWTLGRCLAGAGGGGFVLFVAHDPAAAVALRRRLESRPPNPQARFFDFAVDPTGLQITVL